MAMEIVRGDLSLVVNIDQKLKSNKDTGWLRSINQVVAKVQGIEPYCEAWKEPTGSQ